MADSNSKKPMALLLLVVVAVLVVIMVGQGDSFAGHGELKDEEACKGAKGSWAKAVSTEDVDGDDKATCETNGGTWTDAADAVEDDPNTPDVDEAKAAVAQSCTKEVEADAETCSAPEWAALNEADCGTAHGTWHAAVAADDKADPPVEAKDAYCEAWKAAE